MNFVKIFEKIFPKVRQCKTLITITHQTNKSPAEINDTLSRQVCISCFRALSHFVKFLTLEIQFCRFKIFGDYSKQTIFTNLHLQKLINKDFFRQGFSKEYVKLALT